MTQDLHAAATAALNALVAGAPQPKYIKTLMDAMNFNYAELQRGLADSGVNISREVLTQKVADDKLTCRKKGNAIDEDASKSLINTIATMLIPTSMERNQEYREAFINWQNDKLQADLSAPPVDTRGTRRVDITGIKEAPSKSVFKKSRIDEESIIALMDGTPKTGKEGLLTKLIASQHLGMSKNTLLKGINSQLDGHGISAAVLNAITSEGVIRIIGKKPPTILKDPSKQLINLLAEALLHDAYGDQQSVLRAAFRNHFSQVLEDEITKENGVARNNHFRRPEPSATTAIAPEESEEDCLLREFLERKERNANKNTPSSETASGARIHGRDGRGKIGSNRTSW